MSEKIKKFTSDEVSVFCEQLAIMLNGGIPVFEAVHIMNTEMQDKATKAVLEQLDTRLADNAMLYEALEETKAFPAYMVNMAKIGETTGKTEDVLRGLAEYYERESNVLNAIKNAVAYPIVLFAIMAVILVIMVWKVLPLFEKMFLELSSDVASSTQNSLNFGITLGKVIAIVTIVVLALVFAVFIWYKTKPGEKFIKEWLTNFKGTGKLSYRMAIGRFVSAMSLMLAGGMNITEALELTLEASTNKTVTERIEECKKKYEENAPFDEAIRDSRLIEGMEAHMITIGVKSGAVDDVFAKLSKQYNDEVTAKLSKISSSVETILVVILAVLVGAVLLSVMVPLVSMISSIA